jgi:hypothetical protein
MSTSPRIELAAYKRSIEEKWLLIFFMYNKQMQSRNSKIPSALVCARFIRQTGTESDLSSQFGKWDQERRKVVLMDPGDRRNHNTWRELRTIRWQLGI